MFTKIKFNIILFLSSWFARIISWSYKYEFHGLEHIRNQSDEAYVIAIWHEYLFPIVCSFIGESKYTTMVSPSKDGNIISNIIEKLGFNPIVRGSTSRGGDLARKELIQKMSTGICPVITVDGPKGPRHKVKGGVVYLARESQTHIVPAFASCSKSWIFSRSWDKFCLPMFFATIKIYYGKPIKIDDDAKGAKFAEEKNRVQEALIQLHKDHSS